MDLEITRQALKDRLAILDSVAALLNKQARERQAFATKHDYGSWDELEAALGGSNGAPSPAKAAKPAKKAPQPKRKRAKLTPEQRAEIVKAYQNRGETTVGEVAKKHGVSEVTVYALVNAAKKTKK